MNIPKQLFAGDSVSWFDSPTTKNTGENVSPPDWSLTYEIRGPGSVTLEATVDGVNWKTTLAAAASVGLSAGIYYWQAFAEKDSERVTLGSGQIEIKANLSATLPDYDGRSQARKDLSAVQTAMRAMIAGGGVQAYTIAGRSLQKMSMESLIMLEKKLKAEVALENKKDALANGLANPNNILVRFK